MEFQFWPTSLFQQKCHFLYIIFIFCISQMRHIFQEVKLFASHYSLVTSHQLLVTSHQLLVTRYQSLVTSHQLLVNIHQLLVTNHQLLNTCHQLLLTSYQLILTISSQLIMFLVRTIFVKDIREKCLLVTRGMGGRSHVPFFEKWKKVP